MSGPPICLIDMTVSIPMSNEVSSKLISLTTAYYSYVVSLKTPCVWSLVALETLEVAPMIDLVIEHVSLVIQWASSVTPYVSILVSLVTPSVSC